MLVEAAPPSVDTTHRRGRGRPGFRPKPARNIGRIPYRSLAEQSRRQIEPKPTHTWSTPYPKLDVATHAVETIRTHAKTAPKFKDSDRKPSRGMPAGPEAERDWSPAECGRRQVPGRAPREDEGEAGHNRGKWPATTSGSLPAQRRPPRAHHAPTTRIPTRSCGTGHRWGPRLCARRRPQQPRGQAPGPSCGSWPAARKSASALQSDADIRAAVRRGGGPASG